MDMGGVWFGFDVERVEIIPPMVMVTMVVG